MHLNRISIVMIAAQLAACSSGGNHVDVTPVEINGLDPSQGDGYIHFEGLWQGALTPDDTLTSSTVVVIVNGWGEFRALTADVQFVGFPHRTGSTLTGELKGIRSPGSSRMNSDR